MATTRKTKKTRTPEETLTLWLAGAAKIGSEARSMVRDRFESGSSSCVEVDGLHYEKFDLADLDAGLTGYVVVEWDDADTVVL
jgi:hypothetical protein